MSSSSNANHDSTAGGGLVARLTQHADYIRELAECAKHAGGAARLVVVALALREAAVALLDLETIERLLPPTGRNGVELIDRITALIAQAQSDDKRCRVWEQEADNARAALRKAAALKGGDANETANAGRRSEHANNSTEGCAFVTTQLTQLEQILRAEHVCGGRRDLDVVIVDGRWHHDVLQAITWLREAAETITRLEAERDDAQTCLTNAYGLLERAAAERDALRQRCTELETARESAQDALREVMGEFRDVAEILQSGEQSVIDAAREVMLALALAEALREAAEARLAQLEGERQK